MVGVWGKSEACCGLSGAEGIGSGAVRKVQTHTDPGPGTQIHTDHGASTLGHTCTRAYGRAITGTGTGTGTGTDAIPTPHPPYPT